MKYDFAVIGAGPAGYVAAKKAASAGLKVVMVEKKKLGGVCLNEGCVPSKTLLQAAKTYHHAKHGSIFGVEAGSLSFDFGKAHAHKNSVMDRMRDGIAGLMKKNKVEVIEGEAKLVKGGFSVNGESHEAENILLCTGSSPSIPPIPGIEADHIVDSTGILDNEQLPESLVIVGGGVIGCEFACVYASVGVPVTVLEAMPEICPNLDPEIAAILRKELENKGVTFLLGAKVEKFEGKSVRYNLDGESKEIESDLVLVATGRKPNVSDLGLEDLGLDFDPRGGVKVDPRGATNLPGVWAAGDVTGQAWLAHAASRMAEVVVHNITGKKDQMRHDTMPAVVYTSPEVAVVGLTKEEAIDRGFKVKTGKIPMAINARYIAENPGEQGMCKVVLDADTNRLLGVHMVGGACSEMIFGAVAMLETELREEEIEEIVFPHPTTSEIMKDVFMAVR
ncbi:dihydrolipoyl dehydrogenase [Opitutales bacterium]|nr:dihydrolipoyl dehydrogenase [Opitutales bacterium]